MFDEQESGGVDERLESLTDRKHQLMKGCQYVSAHRVSKEIQGLAKAEQRAVHYIYALFSQMVQGGDLLEPELTRDVSIEAISLVESEDRARALQPNLPEDEYAGAVHWITACAYDNLASAIAEMKGYNSDGMQQCINEGIEVCRRTQKVECIKCFREYATEVHLAADDIDLAVHFAQTGVAHENPGPHDRRWVGAKDLCRIHTLSGDLTSAWEAGEQAWRLAPTFHTPRFAYLNTRPVLAETLVLRGKNSDAEEFLSGEIRAFDWAATVESDDYKDPPLGEYPVYELARDQARAVLYCALGQFSEAISLLHTWQTKLTERQCLHKWFSNQLRMIAAQRLAGNDREVKLLGRQLEAKAKPARDWITLRCLGRLLNPSVPPSPVPNVADLTSGPFAPSTTVTVPQSPEEDESASPSAEASSPASLEETPSTEAKPAVTDDEAATSAVHKRIESLRSRLSPDEERSEDEHRAIVTEVLNDLLAIDAEEIENVADACWFVYTLRHVIGDASRGREIWQRAQEVSQRQGQDAALVNLMAALAVQLKHGPNEELADLISDEDLEAMFRQSLDLDENLPRNFSRAGDYFTFRENTSEAERCYARAFRLDRSDPHSAQRLAELYDRTDRSRDALAVLDMCLREGCDEPGIAWSAALTAYKINQHEAVLTYLDRFEELCPGQSWVNYYRGASLLALERPSDALEAATAEIERNPECTFAPLCHRASALGGLDKIDEFRTALTEILATQLTDIDYLSHSGFQAVFGHLLKAAACLPEGDPLYGQLEERLLETGLAPDELFEPARAQNDVAEDVNFYVCIVEQPLDEDWPNHPGCLLGDEEWTSYSAPWGVLARDEDEAREMVLAWQSRCYPLTATVPRVELNDEGYRDRPGVVWQGYRRGGSSGDRRRDRGGD